MKKYRWLFGLIVTVSTSSVFANTDASLVRPLHNFIVGRSVHCVIPVKGHLDERCQAFASVDGHTIGGAGSTMDQLKREAAESSVALRAKYNIPSNARDPLQDMWGGSITWDSPTAAMDATDIREHMTYFLIQRCMDYINAGKPANGADSPWTGPTKGPEGRNAKSQQSHCDRATALAGGEDQVAEARTRFETLRAEDTKRQSALSEIQ